MSLDYGTLTGPKSTNGSIRYWVNYELLDVEGIILDAQAYIYGALRSREMKSVTPVTIAAGASTAPLPTDFLEPLRLQLTATGDALSPVDEAELLRQQTTGDDGQIAVEIPTQYAIWDEALQFDTQAPTSLGAQLLYYRRPRTLGRQNQTNFLTTRYPNLLRVACLMHAADGLQDDQEYGRWKQRADELIARANVEADLVARGRDYSVSVR